MSGQTSVFSGYMSAVFVALVVGSCVSDVGTEIKKGAESISTAIKSNTDAIDSNTKAIKSQSLSCPRP